MRENQRGERERKRGRMKWMEEEKESFVALCVCLLNEGGGGLWSE